MYEINLDNYPSQVYNLSLPKQRVALHLQWCKANSDGFWILTIHDQSGVLISAGRRIKSGVRILPQTINGFIGNIIAIPISYPEKELGLRPWGETHTLVYIDGTE